VLNPPEALEIWVLNQIKNKIRWYSDKSVNRIVNNLTFISHVSLLFLSKRDVIIYFMQYKQTFFYCNMRFYSNSPCYFLEYYHVIIIFVPEFMSVGGCRGQKVPYFIG